MAPLMTSRVVRQVARWGRLVFLAGLVVACGDGGDGGPPPAPEVVQVTVSGLPSAALAPMQTAQLGAQAAYSDGSVKDVTAAAAWSTTDADVLTVSSAGLVKATGPGQAEVVASFGGVSGEAGVQVVALPAAYFIDGVEYAFEYELDAQGRVDNYRISQRPTIAYPSAPSQDGNIMECSGSLHGNYACGRTMNTSGTTTAFHMEGIEGHLVRWRYSNVYGSASRDCSHSGARLDRVSDESSWGWSSGGPTYWRETASMSQMLDYDDLDRLIDVTLSGTKCEEGAGQTIPPYSFCRVIGPVVTQIKTDSQGRLQRAEDETSIALWTYGTLGLMEEAVLSQADPQGVLSTTTTRYAFDSAGWLSSRVVLTETPNNTSTETTDTYAIVHWGVSVAEEQFTQAEPKAFYPRGAQRARYEWGRLPTEPTFVPRALTGLNGADYFGIISSHHR
jgi:hypothetical protein